MGTSMIVVAEKYTLGFAAPKPISSDTQLASYQKVLEQLLDKNRSDDEEKYMGLLIALIDAYEQEHFPIQRAKPIDVIRELIDANSLRQKDLVPIFGAESIVSEILNGSRKLNREHIAKLSKRFGISPAAFF
jgi:HTH-type transcriptional regulator / antitoxin HigA